MFINELFTLINNDWTNNEWTETLFQSAEQKDQEKECIKRKMRHKNRAKRPHLHEIGMLGNNQADGK